MIEFIVAFVVSVAVVEAAVDVGTKAYDYVEPKIVEGLEYIEEKY